ncbi:helix-turn-helix transcriptional regulator [Neobacillus sp. Marseille-QA0830]
MDFRKEEEMFRFLFIEGNAYNKKQLAGLLGMKEKYFYDKFFPRFQQELEEQVEADYVESTRRKKFSYARLKYDAYQYNENVLMAFYRQNKALRPIELERLTDMFSLLSQKAMTKEEVVREVNKRHHLVVDNAFSRSFDRSFAELERLGVVYKTKAKKPYQYKLDHRLLEALTTGELLDLYGFVHYVSNTASLSVPGYFLLDIVKEYLACQAADAAPRLDIYSYKYINFGRILDEYKCMQLLYALEGNKYVKLRYYPKDAKKRAHVATDEPDKPELMKLIPLRLLYDHQYGRWYFLGVKEGEESYRILKLEGIADIGLGERIGELPAWTAGQITGQLDKSWLLGTDPPVTVHVKFYFEPSQPQRNFIRERVERQGQWGKITEEGEDFFLYEIQVNGTREIKPWIRSFGSSAEVVAPKDLREELIAEWRLLAEEYADV